MWGYVKWTFRGILAALVVSILHYNLPHHDIVRITNTYNRQTVIGSNWLFYASSDRSPTENERRDIRFIEAIRPNGNVSIYRNEDTGWVWPPYFKYDSSNLQAEATNLISADDAPQWVVVTHYGWRTPLFSIYPNAVKVKAVAGPDVRIIPWVNIVILALLAMGAVFVMRMWRQFRQRDLGSISEA